jgi:cell wall-associated NlpC family hydrolase
MNEPEPGDFEVVPVGGDAGRLIRIGQFLNCDGFKNYEHARLYLGDGKCVEARPGGAQIVKWDPNDGGLWSTGLFHITDVDRTLIVSAGYEYGYAHTPYSAVDYFALVAYRLKIGLLVPGLREYVETSKHMICSQLVDKCYQDAGVQLFDDKRWNGYVTPAALATLILHRRYAA